MLIGMAWLYRTRPQYITLTSAHDRVPDRAVAGTVTSKRTTAGSRAVTLKPCVGGENRAQVPNGDTSCASPYASEASVVVMLSSISFRPPGVCRNFVVR